MNADRLLALYEKVAEAPDAVPRLRRFVLDLAVRGKLVPQEAGDVSPVKLLAEARKQLKAQAETAKRMRWKQTDAVSGDEIDKDVPSGWVAARVNDTGLYINGLAFKPADWKQSGIPIIRIQNLTDPQKEFNYAQGDFPEEVMVREGDLLVSWSATLEAFKWDRGEGVLNQHIFRVIPHEGLTDRGFLLLLLRHAIREMADSEHAHGLVMTHINRGPFLNHVVLIPPLAEQRRIVGSVEELMALLDRLEAARTAREATRDRLTAASLVRLTSSASGPDADPAEFPANARFALATLPALTTRPDQIKPLRQTILNLAVRGKLVEQDPTDEPAPELLKRIDDWRQEAVRRKEIRLPRKQLKTVSETDQPYPLPTGWGWARLGRLIYIQSGDGLTSAKMKDGPIPVFGGNGVTGHHDAANTFEPTIVIGRVGYYCGSIHVTPSEAWITDNAFRTKYSKDDIHQEFLELLLNATDLKEQENATAQPVISGSKIYPIVVGLPPLAEQHRIVAKVDVLMALCDRLEAALTTADTTRARLLEALLHEALEPAAEAVTEAAE